MINASGPNSFSSFKYSRTPSRSRLCARILTVTWTRTPCSCANAIPSFISSWLKFFALARSPKTSPPIYTASAPNITAVFNTSRLLAGINNSGCLLIFLSSLYYLYLLLLGRSALYAKCNSISQRKDGCLIDITVFQLK